MLIKSGPWGPLKGSFNTNWISLMASEEGSVSKGGGPNPVSHTGRGSMMLHISSHCQLLWYRLWRVTCSRRYRGKGNRSATCGRFCGGAIEKSRVCVFLCVSVCTCMRVHVCVREQLYAATISHSSEQPVGPRQPRMPHTNHTHAYWLS